MGRSRTPIRIRRLWLALAVLVAITVALGAAAWMASPTPDALAAHVDSRLKGTTGVPVTLTAVAPIMREAVVATEDERFYRHHGIDVIGVLRAIPYDLTHLSYAQGASTITEQVAKVLYLGGNDHSPWRKLEDAAVAVKLESRYDKDQILAAYLDSAYFGQGAYGVRAASERYFGVPPRRLDTAQASVLAGLIQAPSSYDPIRHPGLARDRQIEVLRSLVRNGFLTEAEAAGALARPLRLSTGAALPAVHGIELSPGPAFVWWELAAGAIVVLLGIGVFAAVRTLRSRAARGQLVFRLLALSLTVAGVAVAVSSFRTA